MKKYTAVEHPDHFEIHYAGDKKPFKVAKGVLTKDRLDKIREHADEIKYADGGVLTRKKIKKVWRDAAIDESRRTGGKGVTYKEGKDSNITHAVATEKPEDMNDPYHHVPGSYLNSSEWRDYENEVKTTIREPAQQDKAIRDMLDQYRSLHKLPPYDQPQTTSHEEDFFKAEGGMVADQQTDEPMLKQMYGDDIPHLDIMADGGYVVERSHDRKGKTHKVTNKATGEVRYFGDSELGQHPKDKGRRAAFYARHRKNLANNPFFRAFAKATWKSEGGVANYDEGTDSVDAPTTDEGLEEPSGSRGLLEPAGYRENPDQQQTEVSDADRAEASKIDEEVAQEINDETAAKEAQYDYRKEQARTAPRIRKYVLDSLADTDLSEADRNALAEEAASQKDPNAYDEITSTAFRDALNEGATLPEARKIVRQMRRRGEDIGVAPNEGEQAAAAEKEGVVDLSGLETPEAGTPLTQLASEAMTKKGAAPAPTAGVAGASPTPASVPAVPAPAAGAHQPPVEKPAAAGEPTIPAKPMPGEVAVPESELMQMPEYTTAYESMLKASGGKDVDGAKAFAKEYALKSRQAQVFDTTRDEGVLPEEAFQKYVEEQVKEANFQSELNRRAFAAAETLRAKDTELQQRKEASMEMRMRILNDRAAKLRDDIANFKEDPRRYFSSLKGTDRTMMQIFTFIASLGGRGDDLINGIVNRDLNLQRAELSKKETLLGKYIQEGHDIQDAYRLSAATQKEIYATKLDQIAGQIKDPLMASQARATAAKLRAQNVDDYLTVAKKGVDLDFRDDEIQNRIAHRSAQDMIGLMNARYRITKEGRLAKVDPYAKARLDLAIERENRMRRKEMRDIAAAEGTPEQKKLLNGENITGVELQKVDPKVAEAYAVPVLDATTGRPTGYYTAAHSKEGKDKLVAYEVARKDFMGSLDQLEGLLPASIGKTGLAGYSETASPEEYRQATILQRDLITKLGKLADLGVLQKSDVDFFMTIIPNLTSYERAKGKQAAFATFRQMFGRILQNRKDAYLVRGDMAPPTSPAPVTPYAPTAPAPQLQPLQFGPRGVAPTAPTATGGVRPPPPAKPPIFKRSKAP